MKIYIKNMVSLRCKMAVDEELRKLGVKNAIVELGLVTIRGGINPIQLEKLKTGLMNCDLEVIDDVKSILVERVKNLITEMICLSEQLPKVNYSHYLSERTGYNYTYLSNVFSHNKGITIQQFIILNKIEKIKELMGYNQLSLTEISYRLHYSSVAHLSNQFKKVTGLTPSFYNKQKPTPRINLESL